MSNKKNKDEGISTGKAVLIGLGAAVAGAIVGVGSKMIYDHYKKQNNKNNEFETTDINEEDKEKNVEESNKINKLKEKLDNKPIFNQNKGKESQYYSPNFNDEDEEENDENKPQSFVCPINQTIMKDPVITPYGTTYERSAIEDWLENHNTDPLTHKKLTKDMLITNYALKSAIEEEETASKVSVNKTQKTEDEKLNNNQTSSTNSMNSISSNNKKVYNNSNYIGGYSTTPES